MGPTGWATSTAPRPPDGLVDWERVLRMLKEAGYDGPLCFHNFYEYGMEHLIARTSEDVEYIRSILATIY